MSRKPENQFIDSVHYHLVLDKPYRMKNHNEYVGGIADMWYSGRVDDMWVEYKYITHIPKSDAIKLDLTPLQIEWLRGRYEENRNVIVVLGMRDGGIIFENLEWNSTFTQGMLLPRVVSRREIAAWIAKRTHGKYIEPDRSSFKLKRL